jgi:Uma2 family endonuclease
MATQPRRGRWTYEEFARLPEDGKRYEIIAGELYVTPAPRPRHQEVLGRLHIELGVFANEHGLGIVYPGPIDVLFAEGDYFEPDLVFVRHDRKRIVSERGIEAAPDLVIEILSASTGARDRGIKRERYALFGVPDYWIVNIEERRIERHRLPPGTEPEILPDTLVWQPIGGGPVLTLSVTGIFPAG